MHYFTNLDKFTSYLFQKVTLATFSVYLVYLKKSLIIHPVYANITYFIIIIY